MRWGEVPARHPPSPSCPCPFFSRLTQTWLGSSGGGPSIPRREEYLISRPPQRISPRPLQRWMPVPSSLFLAGVNRRKNTSINNPSASQELRQQGTPGQTGNLCPSRVTCIACPSPCVLSSFRPLLSSPKVLPNLFPGRSWPSVIYTRASHT